MRAYQVNSDDESDEEREQVKALQYGKASQGLKTYLSKKQRNIRTAATGATKPGGADPAASQEGQERHNFDRLCGILDQDDPRFERLHKENIQHLQRGVEALTNNMGLAVDQFYSKTN